VLPPGRCVRHLPRARRRGRDLGRRRQAGARDRAVRDEIFVPETGLLRFGSYYWFTIDRLGGRWLRLTKPGGSRAGPGMEQVGDVIKRGDERGTDRWQAGTPNGSVGILASDQRPAVTGGSLAALTSTGLSFEPSSDSSTARRLPRQSRQVDE